MKIKYLLSILINIIFLISLVNAQTVSHPASQVTPGTFGTGDFTFIGDVTIDNTAFSKLIIDSGPSGYSSVDFFNNGVGEWGIGKDSSNGFYIDEFGVANRLTILPGGNVGIGTTIPLGKLHVNLDAVDVGSARFFTPGLPSGSGSGASNFNQLKLGYGDGSFQSAAIRFNRDDVGGNLLQLFHWGESSGLVLKKGGNVGIGTASPGSKLDVAGQIHSTGDICTDVGGGNCLSTVASASNSGWSDDGANVRLVTSTDKVGIGTSTPGAKLHAVGNANTLRVEGTDHTYIEFYPDGPLTRKAYFGFPNAAEDNIRLKNEIATGHIILEPGANVGIGTTNPGSKLEVNGNIKLTGDSTIFNGVGNLQLNSAGTLYLNNNANNVAIAAGGGKVGIGTTSPSLQLEVKQSSALASAGIELENSAGTTTQFRIRGASELGGSRFSIVQNGNDAFTISNTGNVGIGTTGPGTLLDGGGNPIAGPLLVDVIPGSKVGGFVAGGARTLGATPSQRQGYFLRRNDNWNAYNSGLWTGAASSGSEYWENVILGTQGGGANLVFMTGGTQAERMRITPSGNVGIGKSPDSGVTLDISGASTGGNSVIQLDGATYDGQIMADGAGTYFKTITAGGVLRLGTNNAERMRIDSSGNVGIGSVNPGAKLDVVGNIKASGTICDGSNNCIGSGSLWTDSGLYTYLTQTGDSVGIGTSTPGAKLHAVGNANTLRVEGTDHTYIEFYPDGPLTRKAYLGFPDAASNDIRLKNEIATGHIILEPGANVGIGALSPNAKLHVEGEVASVRSGVSNIRMLSGTNPAVLHRNDGTDYHMLLTDNANQWGGWNALRPFRINLPTGDVFMGNNVLTVQHGGNVGIGATNPGTKLSITDSTDDPVNYGQTLQITRAATAGQQMAFIRSGNRVVSLGYLPGSNAFGFGGGQATDSSFIPSYLSMDSAGNVGIGTASPGSKLTVAGDITVSGIIRTGGTILSNFNSFGNPANSDDALNGVNDVYIEDDLEVDGTLYLTGGYSAIVNSDIAEVLLTKKGIENVHCAADEECWKERKIELESYERELEFGDLVCGSIKIPNIIEKCTEANSKSVIGFVSNTSSLNMGNNLKFGYPVAVSGIVYAKVTNMNGNINPTDLLVSSDKDGYAMKNDNPKYGTVTGKAFDFCHEEECTIKVFVMPS